VATTDVFPPELSDSDALMWRIEADPVLRSPVIVVALLDRPPTWPSIVSAFDRAAEVLPRLRQRVVRAGLGTGRLRWEDVADFSAAHHLRRIRAAEANGIGAALAIAACDATSAFDPARPPWQAVLVEGIDGNRAALVLRFHHSITDGIGGIDLAEAIFDRARRPRAAERDAAPEAAPSPPPARPSDSPVRMVTDRAGQAVHAARHPVGTLRTAQRGAASVIRILAPVRGSMSAVLVGRGVDRQLLSAEVPLATLEHAATSMHGTVNDVFLAVVGGALHRYHEELGAPVCALRVTMPINLRAPGDPPGGNHFAPARFVLPVDDPDLLHRTRLAGAIVRKWRSEPSLGITDVLAAVLNRLPRPVVTRFFADLLRSIDVDVVDVPGFRHRAYLAGAQIERLWAFAPPTGAALSFTLVSHDGTACIGVNCDLAAVSEPEQLSRCLEQAIDELDLRVSGAAVAR
jgi:WS/DGAT/MGAT family acyltransferase